MRKLASTAEKHHCAVILIGHMNKGNGAKNLYRGLGSIDIAAIARSVLMISRDESRPGIRYMYPIKSSLAPEGAAIAFSFSDSGCIAVSYTHLDVYKRQVPGFSGHVFLQTFVSAAPTCPEKAELN